MTIYNMAARGAVATPEGDTPVVNNLTVWLTLVPLLQPGDVVYWPAALPPTGSKEDCSRYVFWSNGTNNTLILQIPDGVTFMGDGRSTRLECIDNPVTGQTCRFLGRTLKPSETGVHGNISIERLSVRHLCTGPDEQSHAIMFGSGAPGAELANIIVRDVRVEESRGGDGVVFSTSTRDVLCERVEVGRTVRRAISISGHGNPGTRRNFVVRDCSTVNSPIRTNGFTCEHEDSDGTFENVLVERCIFSGSMAMGRLLGAIVQDTVVNGSVVFGLPKGLTILNCRFRFLVEPHDSGLGGSDAHRGLNLYGVGTNVLVKNTVVSVWDPLNRIAAGKAHALVVASTMTTVTLENVSLDVDAGKLATSGIYTGTPVVTYH